MNKPSDITKTVLKKSKKYLILKTVCSIIYRVFVMVIPILISMVVNAVTNGDYKKAIYIALIGTVVSIIFRLWDILNTYTWHKLYNSLYDNYTKIGEDKVFDNSLYSLSRFNVGEFLNIMSTDINIMSDFICNLIMRIIRIFEVLVIFIYFFMIDKYIGITSVGMTIISMTVIILSSKTINDLNHKKSIKLDERNTVINEFLLSIREIKAFNLFSPMKSRIDENTNKYTMSFLKQRVGEDVYKFSVLSFIEFCRWSMVIYSIYLIAKGHLEVGTLLIIYNYFAQLVDGFSEFTNINIGISQLKVSQDRFYELIIYSHEKLALSQKYKLNNYNIDFENIVYGDKQSPLLKEATFNVIGNSINTFAGLDGSGKNGVVELLMKLNSQHSGTITIDTMQISEFDFESYFNLISCVDINDNFLNISIKDNLKIMSDNFEEIVYMCKKLGIHDEISRLKNGYDTILNSEDDKLKNNTKILLNIARILLKNTKIMIFDEILSSLRTKDKEIVLKELNKIKKEHTIIIIDNDKYILEHSDNIVLLNEGKVSESGQYNEIKNSDIYEKICTQ